MASYRTRPIVALETRRLLLKPLQETDAPRIQQLFPNLNVLRYINAAVPWPYPEDGAITFVRESLTRIESREEYVWAIVRKGSEEEGLIGIISLTPAAKVDSRGFWIGEEYWGKGYMKEASTAVTDFAFTELGMQELLLSNAEPNIASHRLKEAAGAEIISIQPTDYVGGTFPGVRWRLSAEAWAQNRAKFIDSNPES
ncbi:MAG: GNAT family N-acetyltransferase [Fimbriimonas sp.]